MREKKTGLANCDFKRSRRGRKYFLKNGQDIRTGYGIEISAFFKPAFSAAAAAAAVAVAVAVAAAAASDSL
jgi:hypothetical protein